MRLKNWLGLLFAIGALALQAGFARAAPESGFWWNRDQSGYGIAIEVQGTTMFMGIFLYDESGRSTWYASAGPLQADGSYQGTLQSYGNGQTLTGAYKSNAVTNANAGNVTLQFSDATHGTLTWPGGTIPIERFIFGSGTPGFKPETGLWWNPAETGRGFLIEAQGTSLWLGGYMYDDAGNPVWYAAAGPMASTTLFQGHWDQYSGGQTLTGAYRPPAAPSNAGNVTLQITSATSATLTLPDGRAIPLTRFYFSPTPTGNATSDAIFLAHANPANVSVTTDSKRVVTQVVGVGGGTLNAADVNGNQYTLTIPANALTEDTAIQMTPITGMTGAWFASQFVAGVQFAPEGLSLAKLAVLTIVPATAVPLDRQTLVAAQGNGNDVHLAIPGLDPAQIQVSILHFSGYALMDMATSERIRLIAQKTVDQAARLDTEIANIYAEHRRLGLVGGEREFTPEEAAAIADARASYYKLVVLPRVLIAATSCENATIAQDTLTLHERHILLLGGEGHPDFDVNLNTVSAAFANMGRPCAYRGTGTLTTTEFTIVTEVWWESAKSTGNFESYRPRSGNATITFTELAAICTYAPSNVPIDPENGGLLGVDYNTATARYTGYGLSKFTVIFNCHDPDFNAPNFIAVALYLGMLDGQAEGQLKGIVIHDEQEYDGVTLEWEYRGCVPIVAVPHGVVADPAKTGGSCASR